MLKEEQGLEEAIRYCGTPLEPYQEDSFPSRKKIAIEEQIVKDAQGRQRFHGAFTGGFSAGFFNTVGSLEGWNPREFKSSRQEKADGVLQKPEDFMDDEDIGEFGFAPRRIKAKKEYAVKELRRGQVAAELSGPIPGDSILKTIIRNSRETIGDILIRNLNYSERIRKHQEFASQMRMYGCMMPSLKEIPESVQNKEYKIPDLFRENLEKPRSNTSGLGHENLERLHIANTVTQNSLVVKDVNDKKFTIRGQAFGVGAFEQEDEDIYFKEDMSNYDFELSKEKEAVDKTVPGNNSTLELELFVAAIRPLMVTNKHKHLPPIIDQNNIYPYRVRKSRFEPLKKEMGPSDLKKSRLEPVDASTMNKPKGGLDPIIRARYLGETVPEAITSSNVIDSKDLHIVKDESAGSSHVSYGVDLTDRFVSSTASENVHDILEEVKATKAEHGTEEMRAAAKMKMFGDLTRQSGVWHPSHLLCKRFNVEEPHVEQRQLSTAKRKLTREVIFLLEQNEANGIDVNVTSEQGEVAQKKIKLEEIETTNAKDIVEPNKVKNEDKQQEHEAENLERENNVLEYKALVDVGDKIGVEGKADIYTSVFCDSSESEREDGDEETKVEKSRNSVLNAMDLFSSESIKHPFKQVVAEVIPEKMPKDPKSDLKAIKTKSTIVTAEELILKNSLRFSTKEKFLNTLWDRPLYGPALPPKLSNDNSEMSIGNGRNHHSEPEDNEYEWIEKERLRKWRKEQKKEKKRRMKSAKSRKRARK